MVLYSSCVAEFRGNLFSLDFVLLIGLCNLNNLLSVYEIPPCGCPVFLCCFCSFLVIFFISVLSVPLHVEGHDYHFAVSFF